MSCPCPYCGRYPAPTDALTTVTLNHKSWGGAPAPWLGGPWGALQELVTAGYAAKTPAGWYVPTGRFPGHAAA